MPLQTHYLCSDLHDDVEALEVFADFVQAQGANGIQVLGDLALRPYSKSDLDEYYLTKNLDLFIERKRNHAQITLREMKRILNSSGVPYNVIPGNYDSNKDLEAVFGMNNLHRQSLFLGEAKTTGYGGADDYPPHISILAEKGEIVPFDNQELYDLLVAEQPAIGIIHTPPQRLCDDRYNGHHVGTPASATYLVRYSPKQIWSGHIHEAGPNGSNPNGVKGVAAYQGRKGWTVVLNPGNLGRWETIYPDHYRLTKPILLELL
ncbi:MAG TPA: metallophosphoesterase [Candidatus Nanoarchaeia archaeon]|nr:metallophosphoesterase [Candidatus Nanoarchaeia archaeon]